MEEIKVDLEGLEDFDTEPAMYQVWAIGYNEKQEIVDFDVFINESKDPNKAVEYAKEFIIEERFKTLSIPDEVHFLSVEVETIVNTEGYEENIGTIFQDGFKIK